MIQNVQIPNPKSQVNLKLLISQHRSTRARSRFFI